MSGVPRRAGKGATAALPRLLAISDRRALPGGLYRLRAGRGWLAATVPPPAWWPCRFARRTSTTTTSSLSPGPPRAVWEPPRLLLINGRIDVALAAGADGVHLPAAGLPLAPLRRLAARHHRPLLLGRSTHTPAEVVGGAVRRRRLRDVRTGLPDTEQGRVTGRRRGSTGCAAPPRPGCPVLALGGVSAERLAEVAAAGAHGAAAIRAFADAGAAAAMAAAVIGSFPAAV